MTGFQQKNSSSTTILALLNNMLGATMLSLPIMFRQAGILSGTIVLAFSAVISFITCRIYVLHNSKDDAKVEDTLRRILGKEWEKYFRFSAACYLILLSIITFDLIVDQFYSIIYSLCKMGGNVDFLALKTQFSFSKFSTQWLSLLLFIPLMKMVSLKNISLLVKLSEYGAFAIFLYAIYVIIQFFVTMFNGQIMLQNVTWFSLGAIGKAGTCSLAFTIQPIVITFMKQNKNQHRNEKDLKTTYVMAFFAYQIIAVLGTLTVSGKQCSNTIVDCFLHDWTILIVSVSYLFGRFTILPVALEVGRTRILELFCSNITEDKFKKFNIGFMIVATFFSVVSPYLSVSLLMNINGALICYWFIYLIPTKLHWGCLYPTISSKDTEIELLDDLSTQSSITCLVQCNHSDEYVEKRSYQQRCWVYGIINLFGLTIAIFGLYHCIQQIANF